MCVFVPQHDLAAGVHFCYVDIPQVMVHHMSLRMTRLTHQSPLQLAALQLEVVERLLLSISKKFYYPLVTRCPYFELRKTFLVSPTTRRDQVKR